MPQSVGLNSHSGLLALGVAFINNMSHFKRDPKWFVEKHTIKSVTITGQKENKN